jgi:hypothetical protein
VKLALPDPGESATFQAHPDVSIQVGNVTFGYHSALNVGAKDVNFFLSSPKYHGGKNHAEASIWQALGGGADR